jgi:hypothetical protein
MLQHQPENFIARPHNVSKASNNSSVNVTNIVKVLNFEVVSKKVNPHIRQTYFFGWIINLQYLTMISTTEDFWN